MVAGLSLIVLVAVVLIAWRKNLNAGILGITGAFLIGFFVMTDAGNPISSVEGACTDILNAFPTTLVLRILFSSLFFAVVANNGTLEALTGKAVNLARGNQKLLPIIVFIITAALGFSGVNGFTLNVLIIPIAVSLANKCGQPVLLFVMAQWCGQMACMNSKANAAVGYGLINSLAEQNGFTMNDDVFIRYFLICFIQFVIYYIVLGGWKYPKVIVNGGEKVVMNGTQRVTTAFVILYVILAFLGYEVAVVSAALSSILILVTKADAKKAIAGIPWTILVLLGGMAMLIKTVGAAGGITLMVDFLSNFMNSFTVLPIVTTMAGLMSTVSSATGVVQPTMFAMAPELSNLHGVSTAALGLASQAGAQAASCSPFSTAGGMFLGYAGEESNKDNKLFLGLLICAIWNIISIGIYAVLGGFGR